MRVRFNIDPIPASRPKVRCLRKGKRAIGIAYYTEPYKGFKARAERVIRAALPDGYVRFEKGQRITVRIRVVAAKPKTSRIEDPLPDVDNYAKAIQDASNGLVWYDDRYIKRLVIQKEWGDKGRIDMEVTKFA